MLGSVSGGTWLSLRLTIILGSGGQGGPPPETKGVFGRGETVCAAHLPFLLPQMIVACFFGPYYVSGSRINQKANLAGEKGTVTVAKCLPHI